MGSNLRQQIAFLADGGQATKLSFLLGWFVVVRLTFFIHSDALVFYYNHGRSTGWFKVSEAIRRLRLGRQNLSLVSQSVWLCTDVPLFPAQFFSPRLIL